MKSLYLTLLLGSLAALAAEPAKNKAKVAKPEAKSAKAGCSNEAEKLCPGFQWEDGSLRKCLHDHETQLSDTCRIDLKAKPPAAAKP